MNILRTTLATLVAAVLLAPLANAAHSVTITSGDAKAGDYTMSVTVDKFKLVPFEGKGPVKGEGHIHYLINDKAAPGDYATTATTFTFKDVKAGDKLSAELVLSDHTSSGTDANGNLNGGRVLTNLVTVGAAGAPGVGPLLLIGLLGLAGLVARRRA